MSLWSALAFLKIVTADIWRVPGCFSFFYCYSESLNCSYVSKNSYSRYLNSSSIFHVFLYCSSESLKWSCVSKNCYGRYLKSSRMLHSFLLFQQVFENWFGMFLPFSKSLRWVLEDYALSHESILVSTNIMCIFALFQMLRLLRDSATPGKKIEAGYLCTGWNIRRIDISSPPKGSTFSSS